jgi:hypothetical protein
MPEINTDKVCFVIIKASEFDVQVEGLEADDSNATDDNFPSVFASGRDDSVRKELKAFIDGMDEDEQCELVALCWLGRGDFSTDEWDTVVE